MIQSLSLRSLLRLGSFTPDGSRIIAGSPARTLSAIDIATGAATPLGTASGSLIGQRIARGVVQHEVDHHAVTRGGDGGEFRLVRLARGCQARRDWNAKRQDDLLQQ